MPSFNIAIDAIVPPGPLLPNAAYLLRPTGGTPAYSPSLIDPVNDSKGEQSQYSIITYAGNLFRPLINTSTGSIDMWVSTDSGITWAKIPGVSIINGASAGDGFFSSYWDGISTTVNICYPVNGVAGAIQLVDFNLFTQTFGTPYGIGGPSAITCPGLAKRADGSIVAAYTTTQKGHTRLFAAVFQGVWNASVEISSPVPINAGVGRPQFIFDPVSQTLHTFIPTTSSAPAFIQQAIGGTPGGSNTFVTISPAIEGNTLIVFASSDTNVPVTGITCTNVNFTRLIGGQYAEVWVGTVVGGASGTALTVHWAAASNNVASVSEFSNVYLSDGGSVAEGMKGVQVIFTTTSSTTWTAPPNVTSVSVQCIGAGGNGGSDDPAPEPTSPSGGGGGGGGSGSGVVTVIPGNTYNIVVASQHSGGPSTDKSTFSADLTIFGQTGSDGNALGNGGAGGNGSTSVGSPGKDANLTIGGDGGTAAGGGGTGGAGGNNSMGQNGNVPGGGGGGGAVGNPGGFGAGGQVKLVYTPNTPSPQTGPYTSTGYDVILACVGILENAFPNTNPAGYTALTPVNGPSSLQANYKITPNNVPGGSQSAAWTYAGTASWTALILGLFATSNVNWWIPFLSNNMVGTGAQFPNALGANTVPSFAFGLGSPSTVSGSTSLSVPIQTIDPVSLSKIPGLFRKNVTSGTPWVLDTSVDSVAPGDNSNILPGQIVSIGGTDYLFWLASAPGVSTGTTIIRLSQNPNDGSGWSMRTALFNAVTDDPAGLGSVAAQLLHNFSAVVFIPPTPPAPPQVPQPAGNVSNVPTKPNLVLFLQLPLLSRLEILPNPADYCLLRDWRMYNRIDWKRMTKDLTNRPFANEEWDEEGIPYGGVVFNSSKAIPLPDPAIPETVIFSVLVPIAYNGIVTGQYHNYVGPGVFVEGGGDIAWRVRVNGRYLRNMGNMLVTQGTPKTLSAVAGGAFVQSHNLIEYVVSAPNASGLLPLPGQGRILAGLHGYFFPRTQ